MCELLVRVRDKPLSGDAATDCQRTMRGDVIDVRPDGCEWTPAERSNPDWAIVRVRGMSEVEGQALAAPEPSGLNPRARGASPRFLRKRMSRLDVDALGILAGCREYTVQRAAVRLAKARKPAVAADDEIGVPTDPMVIG